MVRRIRPISSRQHPKEPIRLIARAGKPRLKVAIAQALSLLGDDFDNDRALFLLRNGRGREIASEAVDWHHYRETLKGVFSRWTDIALAGAELGARKINGLFHSQGRKVRFRKAIGGRFNFDMFDPETVAAIRAVQDELIAELSVQVRDTIEAVILRGQMLGLDPVELIAEIESVISLTATQAAAVMNYERMLRELDSGALARQLRNTAYDVAVRSAIDNDVAMSEAGIMAAVADYEARYIAYRAETIAQTESVRAANFGLHAAYTQAIDRGALPDEAVRRYWQTAMDEGVCPICEAIPDNNADGVRVGENFNSSLGPVDDPPVHPACRCSISYVTDLDKVPDDKPGLAAVVEVAA